MDKVVIVTGGSRGIGAATSMLLALNGYAVCINYRSRNKDAELLADKITQQGGKVFCFCADVSKEDDVIRLFEAVLNRHQTIAWKS